MEHADEQRVRALLDIAQRARGAGRHEDSANVLEQLRAIAPEHPMVLSMLAERALTSGDAAGARAMLERAVITAPNEPALRLNLALACRTLGDSSAELANLDKALGLDPYYFLALLQKARLYERLGEPKLAASVYSAVLACAPQEPNLPAPVTSALAHARAAVQANTSALENVLREKLAAVRAQYSEARQDRFDGCLEALLHKRRVFAPQPTFMHFPYLPALEFYDRDSFDWLPKLEAATADIRAELVRVLAEGQTDFEPYVANPEGVPLNQWKELNHSRKWSVFYLWRDGVRNEEHCARCPRTAEVLESLPRSDVPGHSPSAFFSLLQPKARIPPHTGVTNTRLIVHLALVVPDHCGFRVGAQSRAWREGEAWVFDDTMEHEAWNNSDEPRAVLIFDVWNPYLSAAERDLVRTAIGAVGDYYEGKQPFGRAL